MGLQQLPRGLGECRMHPRSGIVEAHAKHVDAEDAAGVDTGFGFNVKAIEDNPAAYFADVHTNVAVPGAVRGQLD